MQIKVFIPLLLVATTLSRQEILIDPLRRIVPFEESMRCIDFSPARNALAWQLYKKEYTTKFIRFKKFKKPIAQPIPRIFHFIWLGSALPQKFEPFITSWKTQHPTWTIKIWTEKEASTFPLVNRKLFNESSNHGYRSDLLRYEILQQEGGVYVDIDFFCTQSIDELAQSFNFFGCLFPHQTIVANGIIGSIPHHPILQQCIEKVRELSTHSGEAYFSQIQAISGPGNFTASVLNFLQTGGTLTRHIIILPASYFFTLPVQQSVKNNTQERTIAELVETYRRPESYALHFWANSWVN